jgi:hypothetical protein
MGLEWGNSPDPSDKELLFWLVLVVVAVSAALVWTK